MRNQDSGDAPPARSPSWHRSRSVHPTSGEALRTSVLGERKRISKLSRIREVVLGFQDGLLVPLAVVTGLAGAAVSSMVVVVGGLAKLAAGALSMGTGAFLASRAENQLYRAEIDHEEGEIRDHPEVERRELEILFQEEGLSLDDARVISERISMSNSSFNKTKVEKELGLSYEETKSAGKDSAVVGLTYAAAALIPLWPYLFWSVSIALPVSLTVTVLSLFALGLVKGRVVRTALMRSGLEVLLVGGTSASLGYLIGVVVPRMLGTWLP